MINKKNIETLGSFLAKNKESYFVIGGNAVAMHLDKLGTGFRTTEDFDIVLVTKIDDSSFSNQIADFLIKGGYENRYRNEKKTAYRFEKPKSAEYPKVIEFFVKEGEFPQSLDNRFAKLDIKVNEEKISAIVLNGDVYEFAKRHVIYDYDLPIVDMKCLIALKSYAYFQNLELYNEKKVKSDDYLKHKKDIVKLSAAITDLEPISDLPDALKTSISDFLPILEKANDLAKSYRVPLKKVVDAYKKIAGL